MKRTLKTTFALAALLAIGASSIFACPLVYVVNFSGQFGIMDLANGVFIPIGKGFENSQDGIAGAPGGPFYTIDGVTGHLLRITRDGKATDVGDTRTGPNVGPTGISILSALTDGTIYALDFSNRLYKVNTNTGTLMPMQALSLPPQENEYIGNMVTSLAGDGSNLYYTLEIFEGKRKLAPTIFTIDPVKQTVTSKPLKNAGIVIGSGFINGALYLFTGPGEIYRANPATGDAELVSKYDAGNVGPEGPPLTGVFGAINTPDPFAIAQPTKTPEVETRMPQGRQNWPARHWVRIK